LRVYSKNLPTLIISLERGVVNIPNKISLVTVPGFTKNMLRFFSSKTYQ